MMRPPPTRRPTGTLVALGLALAGSGHAWADALSLAGFDCLIQPHAVADVSARGDGVLAEFLVGRGDRVAAGQVIARLDHEVEQASVALAAARAGMRAELAELREALAFAERERARLAALAERNAVSATEVDRATTDAATARLRLERAEEEQQLARLELARAEELLERRLVRSPVAGVVMERLLAVGESADDRPIARVAGIDPLHVEVIVPVEAFGRIVRGQRARITPRYPGARVHPAVVTVVDPIVDAASDTFGVRLELPNADGRIPAGVRCDIIFTNAD